MSGFAGFFMFFLSFLPLWVSVLFLDFKSILEKNPYTLICTPNTGHPVLGVFLCDTVMNTRRCASNYIDKENGSRHQNE